MLLQLSDKKDCGIHPKMITLHPTTALFHTLSGIFKICNLFHAILSFTHGHNVYAKSQLLLSLMMSHPTLHVILSFCFT